MSRKAGPTTLRSGWWQDVQWFDSSTRRAVASSMVCGTDAWSGACGRDGPASGAADDGAGVSGTGGSDGRTRVPSSGRVPSVFLLEGAGPVDAVAGSAGEVCASGLASGPDAGGLPVPVSGAGGRESHPPSSAPAISQGSSRWWQGRGSGRRDMMSRGRDHIASISIVSTRGPDRIRDCSSCIEFQHHARNLAHQGRVFAKE